MNLEITLQICLSSYGHTTLRNVHVSSVTLMCECGYDQLFDVIITEMIAPLKVDMDASRENPGN